MAVPVIELAWHAAYSRFWCPKRLIALLHLQHECKINRVEPAYCVALNELLLGQSGPIYGAS